MIHIVKGREPQRLTEYRLSTQKASYDGLGTDVKNEIRAKLLDEQGHICAYCMERIRMDTVTIEHYIAQHQPMEDVNLELSYHNMLGVCQGNEGKPHMHETCGRHRGNHPLTVDPLVQASIGTISYSSNGQIISSSEEINHDLDYVLNLNYSLLVSNRKAALDRLRSELLKRKRTGGWMGLARKYEQKLYADAVKTPYCGILLWYLRTKTRVTA